MHSNIGQTSGGIEKKCLLFNQSILPFPNLTLVYKYMYILFSFNSCIKEIMIMHAHKSIR